MYRNLRFDKAAFPWATKITSNLFGSVYVREPRVTQSTISKSLRFVASSLTSRIAAYANARLGPARRVKIDAHLQTWSLDAVKPT